MRLDTIKLRFIFQSLRPQQWTKNLFIVIPLFFAQKVFYYPNLVQVIQAVSIFCILSAGLYLINDLVDLESDRSHPVKKNRPLAMGLITPPLAVGVAAFLILSALIWVASADRALLIILLTYTLIQILYNYGLKGVVILDIFCISSGFFLRVIAGCVAIKVQISHWLIICSILLSMFLALAKRRHELVVLGTADAVNYRKILSHYSPYLLDQMIGIVTASTLLSYMLYCISPETIQKFNSDHMIYTIPFVLYGIFRYLFLIHHKNMGGSPERAFFSDLPLLLSVILWSVTSSLIVYGII
jgi:4-hydroxybenzoate polyprenyltransferase